MAVKGDDSFDRLYTGTKISENRNKNKGTKKKTEWVENRCR